MELVVLRVDEVAARRAAHHPQVVADGLGDPGPRRGADDRDRARREERPQVDRARRSSSRRRGAVIPTTRPTPRFSSARATISRWISDVPSQIRSTRSSRKNRSAGELAHVAAAAEDLDDPVGAAERRLGREQLGQRRLGVDDLRVGAGVDEPGALAGEQARRGRVGGRVGQRERHALEVVDPLAELDPLGGPLDRERRGAAPSRRCSAPRCGSAPRRTTRWSARPPGRRRRGSRRPGTRTSSSTNCGCRSANVCM